MYVHICNRRVWKLRYYDTAVFFFWKTSNQSENNHIKINKMAVNRRREIILPKFSFSSHMVKLDTWLIIWLLWTYISLYGANSSYCLLCSIVWTAILGLERISPKYYEYHRTAMKTDAITMKRIKTTEFPVVMSQGRFCRTVV